MHLANSDSEQQVEIGKNTYCVVYADVSYTCRVYEDAGILFNFAVSPRGICVCGVYAYANYMQENTITCSLI